MKKIKQIINKAHPLDVILIALIAIGFIGFFVFFYRKPQYVTIKVKVTDQDVLYAYTQPQAWYANRFEAGDTEINTLGQKISEITNVETFNVTSDKKVVYLTIKIKALFDSRTKLYSAKGKQLAFGIPLRFTTSKITFDGIVTEFPGSEHQKNVTVGTTRVTTLARNIEPAIALSLRAGDTIIDSNKTLLATIENLAIRPAEKVTQTSAGDLLLRYDPLYKDVVMTVTVRTKTVFGETFAFDSVPVKIGEALPLNFPLISLFPFITNIQ